MRMLKILDVRGCGERFWGWRLTEGLACRCEVTSDVEYEAGSEMCKSSASCRMRCTRYEYLPRSLKASSKPSTLLRSFAGPRQLTRQLA